MLSLEEFNSTIPNIGSSSMENVKCPVAVLSSVITSAPRAFNHSISLKSSCKVKLMSVTSDPFISSTEGGKFSSYTRIENSLTLSGVPVPSDTLREKFKSLNAWPSKSSVITPLNS